MLFYMSIKLLYIVFNVKLKKISYQQSYQLVFILAYVMSVPERLDT
jgi:hypothetical protein